MRKLCLGEFDAESAWNDTGMIALPRIIGPKSYLTEYMDELLWGFTEHDEDVLITKVPFDRCLKDYLLDSGCVFETSTWSHIKKDDYKIEPYAITPGVIEMCKI